RGECPIQERGAGPPGRCGRSVSSREPGAIGRAPRCAAPRGGQVRHGGQCPVAAGHTLRPSPRANVVYRPPGAAGEPGMTDAAFLEAILDEPDEDAHRLVYADWLDEQGRRSERGEFIRVQCRRARLLEKDPEQIDLERKEKDLLFEHGRSWM